MLSSSLLVLVFFFKSFEEFYKENFVSVAITETYLSDLFSSEARELVVVPQHWHQRNITSSTLLFV